MELASAPFEMNFGKIIRTDAEEACRTFSKIMIKPGEARKTAAPITFM